jgi:hypothetical protein
MFFIVFSAPCPAITPMEKKGPWLTDYAPVRGRSTNNIGQTALAASLVRLEDFGRQLNSPVDLKCTLSKAGPASFPVTSNKNGVDTIFMAEQSQ